MGIYIYGLALVLLTWGLVRLIHDDLDGFETKTEFAAVAVFLAGWWFSSTITTLSIIVSLLVIFFFKTKYWRQYNPQPLIEEDDVLE